jgi:hypothetical protein
VYIWRRPTHASHRSSKTVSVILESLYVEQKCGKDKKCQGDSHVAREQGIK